MSTLHTGEKLGFKSVATDEDVVFWDKSVQAVFAITPHDQQITDDQCFITLRHADGSVSSVAYLAGGDKAFPKERVEVLGGGRLAVIDDFREVTTCSNGKIRKRCLARQDKGHRGEIEAFARAIMNGGAVTMASILAVRSIRKGLPFDIAECELI